MDMEDMELWCPGSLRKGHQILPSALPTARISQHFKLLNRAMYAEPNPCLTEIATM